MLALVSFIGAGSCSTSISPFERNYQYFFSINGYLDASVDTQWIRVMPMRDSLFYSPKPFDATVTLENITSGNKVNMHDSLYFIPPDHYVHNFWSTLKIQPDGTYRITAKPRESQFKNRVSHVEVTLPDTFPTPVFRITKYKGVPLPNILNIDGIKRLADVSVDCQIISSKSDTEWVALPHLKDSTRTISGGYKIQIFQEYDDTKLIQSYNMIKLLNRKIFVASASPDGVDFGKIDERIGNLPHGVSNVKNGVGFVAGIVSKTIPYKMCFDGVDLTVCPAIK